MNEERLIELETKISHQEFQIEKLSHSVATLEITIFQLEETMRALVKRIQDLLKSGGGIETGPGNEKPPHY